MTEPADDLAAQLVAEIEAAIDDHAALVKHCLKALEVAGVPLSCQTAGALHELADAMQAIIHQHIADEGLEP
jgi:hypothetical protein